MVGGRGYERTDILHQKLHKLMTDMDEIRFTAAVISICNEGEWHMAQWHTAETPSPGS